MATGESRGPGYLRVPTGTGARTGDPRSPAGPDGSRRLERALGAADERARTSLRVALWAVAAGLEVPGMAGLVAVRQHRFEPVAHTHEETHRLDRTQAEVVDGPGVEAARTARTVVADTAEVRLSWPCFVRCAREVGVRSFLCAPLSEDGHIVGTVSLYSERAGAFDGVEESAVGRMAALVTGVLCSPHRAEVARAPGQPGSVLLTERT